MSDGDPTRYDSNQTYNDRNNNYYYVAGTGSGYDSNALSAAQNILRTLNMNYFYTVGVGPQSSYKHLSDLISSVPNGTITNSFNGTNANELQNAFDTIIRDATELLCTNVTVTDTLYLILGLAVTLLVILIMKFLFDRKNKKRSGKTDDMSKEG